MTQVSDGEGRGHGAGGEGVCVHWLPVAPPSAAPSAYPSFPETGRHGYRCWRRTDRLITHCVYDEAERLFGKTATLIPNSPQGPS